MITTVGDAPEPAVREEKPARAGEKAAPAAALPPQLLRLQRLQGAVGNRAVTGALQRRTTLPVQRGNPDDPATAPDAAPAADGLTQFEPVGEPPAPVDVPELPEDVAAGPAVQQLAVQRDSPLVKQITDFLSQDLKAVGFGKVTVMLAGPARLLWTEVEKGMTHLANFIDIVATNGVKAAVSAAKTALSALSVALGPVGWIVNAAERVLEWLFHIEETAEDYVIGKIMGIVTPIINAAKEMALTAIAMAQQTILNTAEPAYAAILSTAATFWDYIKTKLASSPVYNYIKNATMSVINVWSWILSQIPDKLAKLLPQPPKIEFPV